MTDVACRNKLDGYHARARRNQNARTMDNRVKAKNALDDHVHLAAAKLRENKD